MAESTGGTTVNLTRITVVAALAAGAALLPATASAATGVSISGTTWHDLNVDSVCQTGEPALSGKNVFVQAGKIQLVDQDGAKRETRPNDEATTASTTCPPVSTASGP
jgi:hypothetical protein